MQDLPFDRALRRLRRDRAARSKVDLAYLRDSVLADIGERLAGVKRSFADVLEVGSTRGGLARLLGPDSNITIVDPGAVFAADAGGIQCDEDRLPLGEARFDLAVALGTLDTVNDLPGALILIRRALRPGGLFLAAMAGAGSLPRLRAAMLAADEALGIEGIARMHPQIDVRAAGDLLLRAGFVLPVAETEPLSVRFSSLDQLLGDLRALGAANMLVARHRASTPHAIHAARSAFLSGEEGGVETFHLLFLTGWAPD